MRDTPFSMAYQNFHPRCRHIITQYIEALHTPDEVANMREFSNRSYDVGGKGWTKAQTAAANKSLESYRAGQTRAQKLYADKKQWRRYQAVLGDDAPKTFSGFRRMKAAGGEKWKEIQKEYRDVNWMTNAQKNRIVEKTHKVPAQGSANSVFDKMGKAGTIATRRYYNANGHPKLDFDATDHGNPLKHQYVPHSHDWKYNDGKVARGGDRKASRAELLANEDIINGKTGY